jgi:uncharacterized MAPEG superfamily protein
VFVLGGGRRPRRPRKGARRAALDRGRAGRAQAPGGRALRAQGDLRSSFITFLLSDANSRTSARSRRPWRTPCPTRRRSRARRRTTRAAPSAREPRPCRWRAAFAARFETLRAYVVLSLVVRLRGSGGTIVALDRSSRSVFGCGFKPIESVEGIPGAFLRGRGPVWPGRGNTAALPPGPSGERPAAWRRAPDCGLHMAYRFANDRGRAA